MSQQLPLLIELGCDELPVKALPDLARTLFDGIVSGLAARGIEIDRGNAKPLYTPRRLAVLLPGVAVEQPEQAAEVLGPYLNIALDADGQPTRALQGFAAKAGVEWTALEKTRDGKGERFVHRAVNAGARTADLLPDVLREAVAAMPIPRPMRWGAHDFGFARQLHWLVLLFGDDVVDAELFGVRSGRDSRGHRFLQAAAVPIAAPATYVQDLRAAKVLVDPDVRRARIVDEVDAAAKAVRGVARIDADNLQQVNCLVEWPSAVTCSFEPDFLAVPQEALIATMQTNQKFFPVLSAGGKLTAHFIGIANIESTHVDAVRKGYERVIRPRFADARFFFDEDLKQGLVAMGEGLKTVTYQAKLGSVAAKVERVAALAEAIAPQVGVDPMLARRAAELSKNDLQSRMVGEFPELQGIAGRHYALHDPGLSDLSADDRGAVALAIDEAYQPRFAGDDIALSPLGKVLAIAERLDTLAGGFAAGLKPTGNKDPFALRRTALGLARTIIESGFDLPLNDSIDQAREAAMLSMSGVVSSDKAKAAAAARAKGVDAPTAHSSLRGLSSADLEEIHDFILDRLRGYYADKGVAASHFNAVAALAAPVAGEPATATHEAPAGGGLAPTNRITSLYDLDRRIDAIGTFARLPEADALAAANKRINNILKKADGAIADTIDHDLLTEPAERALAEAVEAVYAETGHALAHGDYVDALAHLARLRPQVDAFFDQVMVNADDAALRRNRLALLKRLSDRLGSVAAIEHLSA